MRKKKLKNLHDVYWGTHGCYRRKGHANPCRCECKMTLPRDVTPYGDDINTAVSDPHNEVFNGNN